ncbi:NAD(P)-dependent dehydrogenase (short-subunit alcohol dehydrogenase family) [Bradyrhizobium sp. GM24.11]
MKTVLITGANRGIGLALARQYAAAGAEVIACSRNPEQQALKDIEVNSGGRVRTMQLDVANSSSIASLGRELSAHPIDIVVNNAGVLGPEAQSASNLDAEGWITTLRINALGPILVAQALHANLKLGSEKKLVAIGSVYGSTSKDFGAGVSTSVNRYAYRASKAALNNGMRGLARDWAADGIIVSILDPGWVQTDLTSGAGRLSTDESAQGLIERIDLLKKAESGTFQRYWGEPIPW